MRSGQKLRSSEIKYQNLRWVEDWPADLFFIKWIKFQDTVTILSRENEVLRANVNPEVLASLTGNRNLVGGMNSISNMPCQPPDPTGHPALQPPNQHWATSSAVYIILLYIEANSRLFMQKPRLVLKSEDDIQPRPLCWVNE